MDSGDDGEGPAAEEGNKEGSSSGEEKDVYSEDDNYDGKDTTSDSRETEDDTKSDIAGGAAALSKDLKGWTAGQDSPGRRSAGETDDEEPKAGRDFQSLYS